MKLIAKGSFIIVLVWLCACTVKPGGKEYVQWVKSYENGLHVKTETNKLTLDLQYQPSAYVWMQQNETFSEPEFLKEKAGLDSIQYFVLSISAPNGHDFLRGDTTNLTEEQKKLYYFSYLFQNDLKLKDTSGKTIPCVLYHFERNADLANTHSFVLGFENEPGFADEAELVISSSAISALPVEIKIRKKNRSLFSI